jgi:hypothetical protein
LLVVRVAVADEAPEAALGLCRGGFHGLQVQGAGSVQLFPIGIQKSTIVIRQSNRLRRSGRIDD